MIKIASTTSDGSVTVNVKLNAISAEKELKKLENEFEKLQQKINADEKAKLPLVNQAKELETQIAAARIEVEQYKKAWLNGDIGADREESAAKERLASLSSEYSEVQGKIAKVDERISANTAKLSANMERTEEAVKNVDAAAERLQKIHDSATVADEAIAKMTNELQKAELQKKEFEAAGVGLGYKEYDEILVKINSLNEALKTYRQNVTAATQEPEKAVSRLKSSFAALGKQALSTAAQIARAMGKTAASGAKKLLSYLKQGVKSLLSWATASKKGGSAFSGAMKNMLKYTLGIRSLYVLVNKLRSAIVDAFKNLAQYSTQTNADISMVSSALTTLKNSLATAFAPILTVVAPILTKFINLLSTAADYVARLTAALTGQTSYTKATAVQEDYAASLEDTSGAADDASKSLASFDEINKLSTSDSSSSGGGGSGTDPSEMFEEVAIIPLTFDSWGEAFDAFLDSILNDGIPRLKEGLSSMADWINSFSANLYEMFTFPGAYEKVVAIGAEIAYALNDFVNQIDWATLGGALGAGINTMLGFLVAFIYSFDWFNLGSSLAEMVNNAIAGIDWSNVGALLWAKFKIAIELFAGFITSLDMPQLAQAASDIVIGFYNSMSDTLDSIDWGAIGTQIVTLINNIDWGGMVESIGGAAKSLATALAGFLNGALENFDAWELARGLSSIALSIVDGLLTLLEDIDWQEVGDKITDFIGGIDWSGIVDRIVEGIAAALVGLALLVWGLIEDAWDEVVRWWYDAAYEDGEFTISGLLEGITNAIKDIGIWAEEHIVMPLINGVKRALGINSPSTVMAEIGGNIMQGLINGITGMVTAVKDTFTGLWDEIKGIFSPVADWFENTFSNAWQKVKDVFSTGGEVFEGIKDGILEGLKAIINALIDGINSVIQIPFDGLNSALKTIKSVNILGIEPFSWINTITVPQIPKLATGAVIPPNQEFLAVLGDQSSGNNIEAPESLLRQIMREESGNADMLTALQNIYDVLKNGQTITMDKHVLGKTTYSLNKSESKRIGSSLIKV